MTEFFNGGEMDAFSPSDSVMKERTSSGMFDSTFARCAIAGTLGGTDTSYVESLHWTPVTAGMFAIDIAHEQRSNAFAPLYKHVVFHNNAGTAVARYIIDNPGGEINRLQYLDSLGAWQNVDSQVIPATLAQYVFEWDFSASGTFNLYIQGTPRFEFSGDLSHLAGIAYVRLHNHVGAPHYSQAMGDTDSLIGHRLKTVPVVSAGATSAMTGTYAEIDEIVYNDADYINSATANQVSTFGITAPDLTGYAVQSVTVSARAKRDASGPQNLQLALRVSGTDYFSSSKALSIGYAPYQNIWTTNPASAGAWSNSAAGLVQPGAKSIT